MKNDKSVKVYVCYDRVCDHNYVVKVILLETDAKEWVKNNRTFRHYKEMVLE